MKHLLFKAAAVAAVSLAMCGVGHAAVTFDYADIIASSSVYIDSDGKGTQNSNNEDSLLKKPLETESEASVANGSNMVSAQLTATLNLNNSASGTLSLVGATSIVAPDETGNDFLGAYDDGDIDYYFSINQNSNIQFNFLRMGSNKNYNAFSYGIYNDSSCSLLGISSSGSASCLLRPGNYNLYIATGYPDIGDDEVGQVGSGSQIGFENDIYSFSISAAPEPSAWALMIGGVSVAGLALRRRRPRAALAAG